MAASAAAAWLGFWAALGSTAVVLGALALWAQPALARRLLPLRGGQLAAGGLAGLAMASAAWLIYPAAVQALPWLASDAAGLYVSFSALTLAQAALALPPIIVGEEVVWRGLVHGALPARLPALATIAIGAGLYALASVPTGSPVLVLAAFACGLVWAGLRVATGGLLAPLAAHLSWNLLVLFVWPLPPASVIGR